MTDEMLSALDEIYANANRLVAGVDSSQWELETPCSEWNVKDLVNHMVGTSKLCAASASRGEVEQVDDHLGDDPVGSFATAAEAAATAWRAEGATEGEVTLPAEMPAIAALGVNIIDIGTHVWDLATAVGQEHGLSGETVAMIDQWNRQVISGEVRQGGGFGEDLGVQGEEPLANMLGFVGRSMA